MNHIYTEELAVEFIAEYCGLDVNGDEPITAESVEEARREGYFAVDKAFSLIGKPPQPLQTRPDSDKKTTVALRECRLKELRAWQVMFDRNLLAFVSSHAGQNKVGIAPLAGVMEQASGGYELHWLYGQKVEQTRFLPGDTLVQCVDVDYVPKKKGGFR